MTQQTTAQDTLIRYGDAPAKQPALGDAFGRAVARAWRRRGQPGVAHELIEREDGLITVNDAAKYFAPLARWNPAEQWAVEAARGRVLDVGCGPGRHAVELIARGHEVVGLEPSAGAAAVARERGVNVEEGLVEDLDPALGPFDTILMGGQNLGLLEGRSKAPTVLARLAAAAAPGAVLVGVGIDPDQLNSDVHVAYAARNRAAGRLPGQQRFRIRDLELAGPWFDYLLPRRSDLIELASNSPWRLLETASDGPHYLATFSLDR